MGGKEGEERREREMGGLGGAGEKERAKCLMDKGRKDLHDFSRCPFHESLCAFSCTLCFQTCCASRDHIDMVILLHAGAAIHCQERGKCSDCERLE